MNALDTIIIGILLLLLCSVFVHIVYILPLALLAIIVFWTNNGDHGHIEASNQDLSGYRSHNAH